jgi:hypothetical protein
MEPIIEYVKQTPFVCSCCKKSHLLWLCDYFKKMVVKDKNKFVRENKVCFHCQGTGHMAKNVNSTKIESVVLMNPDSVSFYSYKAEYPEDIEATMFTVNSAFHNKINHSDNGSLVTIRTVTALIKYGKWKKHIVIAVSD